MSEIEVPAETEFIRKVIQREPKIQIDEKYLHSFSQ